MSKTIQDIREYLDCLKLKKELENMAWAISDEIDGLSDGVEAESKKAPPEDMPESVREAFYKSCTKQGADSSKRLKIVCHMSRLTLNRIRELEKKYAKSYVESQEYIDDVRDECADDWGGFFDEE